MALKSILSAALFVGLVVLATSGCMPMEGEAPYHSVQGFTQGTTYQITYQHHRDSLQPWVDSLLHVFDQSLNTYDSTSLISRLNRNEMLETDSLFRTVFRESVRVNSISDGAFDISLAPVINVWGFGEGKQEEVEQTMIDSLLQFVGMENVTLNGEVLWKSDPRVTLNVNAIAQGFAVDYVCGKLEEAGCKNYMVEIGGEIRTRGVNPKGSFWRIGIDRPDYGNMMPGDQLQAIISMHNRSLATSGNYRKFYMKDGVRITHSIDPHTGYPKESNLLSATILCGECITADALATACMVLGLDEAKEFISSQPATDAYFVFGDESGAYQVWFTEGLKKYIETP